jgi:hypothetical protein
MSNGSLLEGMGLTFPSTPTDLDTGTDFSTSLSEVTNPIYRQTPVSYGSDSVVVAAQKEFEKLFPEWAAPLAAALAGAGIISSLASSGPAKVEVTAQKPVTPPPAEPPPTTPTPPPVIPAPVSPSVDPADPTKEVPKQEPTAEEKSLAEKLGIPAATLATLLKYGLGALASYLSYKSAKDAQEQAKGASFAEKGPVTSTRRAYQGSTYKPAAQGGLMTLAGGGMTAKQPFYLGGPTDGMADEVPAHIDNKRPAALSDGEFVIPADVVSHLGNGNSNAGASRLYEMMDRVREARTGNRKQGIQINPNKFMPR